MRRLERLTALRLAPLRSLRALTDPRHAALRTVRLVSAVFHGAAVRCSLPTLGCEVGWGQPTTSAAWRRVPLVYGDATLGLLELRCSGLLWRRSSHIAALLAEPLALLLALHAESPQTLRGTVLSSQPLHELNNAAHALSLQVGVMQMLLERGDTDEARQFAGLCVRQADKLVAVVAGLRNR
ncbi:MAG TPA: hypothetical protein VM847_14800 [Tahibacter sp.]|nr:hypothetical protein [Tahibacter sp.]